MKTLVVHPDDRSTDFLRPVYNKLSSYTLVTEGKTKAALKALVRSHDRIILLGHGTEEGLLAVGKFPVLSKHIIDNSFASILKDKKDLICIWCHADQYVNRYQLKTGFHTGMFISEMLEAMCYLPDEVLDDVSEEHINLSNDLFSQHFGKLLEADPPIRYEQICAAYQLAHNPVVEYNKRRLYCVLD